MKDRIDKILVKKGMTLTRSQARLLIEEGVVFCNDTQITKTSKIVSEDDSIEVRKDVQYVGRGAHKLEGACSSFNIDFNNKVVADIGASTGGFSDFALKNGARKIYAIDVGHDQLAEPIRNDSKVINMEGINVKNGFDLPEKMDLIMVDLSFISLKLVLENIFYWIDKCGKVVVLIKPQFECGKKYLNKEGVLKKEDVRLEVLENMYEWCKQKHLYVTDAMRSPIDGKSGNVEYFFYFDLERQNVKFPQKKLKEIL